MSWLTVAAAGASILGGLAGQEASRSQARDAKKMMQRALAEYSGINLPDINQQKLLLEELKNAGQLTPELEQAILLGPSAMEQVSVDPRLKQQQMDALKMLAGVAESGMTPADQAAFELARKSAAAENQAMQGQILQQMQARGQGGSGAELIARLKGSQSAAEAMQDAQLKQAQAIQAARMQAMSQVGDLSSKVRQQEFGEQSDVARARDLANQFNVQNQTAAQRANVAARNLAQAQNLQNQQNIMNQNVDLRNKQQQFNKGLLQQQFQNQLSLAQGRAGALTGQSKFLQDQAANTAGMYAGIGQGVGTMFGGLAQSQRQDRADQRADRYLNLLEGRQAQSPAPLAMNFDPTKLNFDQS